MKKRKAFLSLLVIASVLVFTAFPQAMATLPKGNGIQKINEHIHWDDPPLFFVRGYYYAGLWPEEFSGKIKVGTWLTIGFGWGNDVPEEYLEEAIANDIYFLTVIWPLFFHFYFDGEEIDIVDCWHLENIRIEDNGDGTYWYYIPFRYYVPPRAVGHYDIVFVWDDPDPYPDWVWAGYIEWVPPKWL
jgi:hypothetical protein